MKVLQSISLMIVGAVLAYAAMQYKAPVVAPDFIPDVQADNGQIGRFQSFNNLTGVALDTKTGRLCRTHDWHNQPPRTGVRVVIPSPYEHEPLCSR